MKKTGSKGCKKRPANGASLGMFIMALDRNNPVLLFLGGGPGIPEYLMEQEYPSGLENHFIICYLEYRGTSLSYNPDIAAEDMTITQYVNDVVSVTNSLRSGNQTGVWTPADFAASGDFIRWLRIMPGFSSRLRFA